jgi:diaminopimelate epimerase
MSRKASLKIPFTKMHGLGNDFVLLDSTQVAGLDLHPDRNRETLEKLAAFLCDRHFGIGADGLILPAPSTDPSLYDIRFVYLNSDGTWAEMCGNGIRCFALFVRDLGLVKQDAFTVETLAGPIRPQINADRTVTVDMGAPILNPEKIPFSASEKVKEPVQRFLLPVLNQTVPVTPVSMGNPHCLVFQDELDSFLDPSIYGPALERHPAFPAKTNVEFVETLSREHLKVIVWERGCGFTLACGTGACATAVGAIMLDKAEPDVQVELPGGNLRIQWDGNPQSHVLMSGPAETVFRGQIEVPAELLSAAHLPDNATVR